MSLHSPSSCTDAIGTINEPLGCCAFDYSAEYLLGAPFGSLFGAIFYSKADALVDLLRAYASSLNFSGYP